MSDGAAVDTDVLLKVAAYRLAKETVGVLAPLGGPATLGLTHLIAAKQMARKRSISNTAGAQAELTSLLGMMGSLEPEEAEIGLAAEFSSVAQTHGLPLDTGEAQLAAIVIMRRLPLLVTGDKRAISAMSELIASHPTREALVGRVACFEQVLVSIAGLIGPERLRERICSEPEIDGAMRLACSCGRDCWRPEQFSEACNSFVGDVRAKAGDLLAAGSALA